MKRIVELLNTPGVGLAEIRVWMEALEQQHDEALNLMLTNAQRAAAISNATEDQYAGTGCEWIEKDTLKFFHERQAEIKNEAQVKINRIKSLSQRMVPKYEILLRDIYGMASEVANCSSDHQASNDCMEICRKIDDFLPSSNTENTTSEERG